MVTDIINLDSGQNVWLNMSSFLIKKVHALVKFLKLFVSPMR